MAGRHFIKNDPNWEAIFDQILSSKMKDIIKYEKIINIPDRPPIHKPKGMNLSIIGEQKVGIQILDKEYIKDEDIFVRK